MAIGYGHRNTVLIIYAISGFFGMMAIVLNQLNQPKATLGLALLLILIVLGAEKIGMRTGGKTIELTKPGKTTSISH
jgi:UDP-GlcNAc:undecaprenyl-phosphate/decaprenyl-phosphate GlcNAc-1-phosphate transferase